jgi:hypothetical protein
MAASSLHDRRFYGWVAQQGKALQNRDSQQPDWDEQDGGVN